MSSSSSKSNASQSSSTTDNRVVAAEGSITATGGSTINYLDKDVALGAMDLSEALGKAGLSLASTTVEGGFQTFIQLADQQAKVTEASRVANNNLAQSLAETAISKVTKNAENPNVAVVDSVTKAAQFVALASGVIGLVIYFKKK